MCRDCPPCQSAADPRVLWPLFFRSRSFQLLATPKVRSLHPASSSQSAHSSVLTRFAPPSYSLSAPGVWSQSQISQWKEVTSRVHAKQGVIYLQLWALGRANQGGQEGVRSVAPSPIPIEGAKITPEEMTEEDILRESRCVLSRRLSDGHADER